MIVKDSYWCSIIALPFYGLETFWPFFGLNDLSGCEMFKRNIFSVKVEINLTSHTIYTYQDTCSTPNFSMMDYRKRINGFSRKKLKKSENNSSCGLQVWVKVITIIMNVQTEELIKDVNSGPCLSTESVLLDTLRYHQTSYFQTHIIWPRRGRITTSNWRQDSGRWETDFFNHHVLCDLIE